MLRFRSITCCYCHNSTSNQFEWAGHSDMVRIDDRPEIFIHRHCAVNATRTLMREFELPFDHPFVARFYSPHDHTRY